MKTALPIRSIFLMVSTCCLLSVFAAGSSVLCAQGLSPATPAQEFIRLNGQVAVIENGATFSRISVGSDGTIWALTNFGSIFRYNTTNQNWQQVPGGLAQIAVGDAADVWGLNAGQLIYQYNTSTGLFQQVGGALTQISVGPDHNVWGINSVGQAWHYTSGAWVNVAGTYTQIAAGDGVAAWALNNGNIYQYNSSTKTFGQIGGTLSQIAVGSDNDLWGLTSAGYCYHYVSSSWINIPGAYAQIAVGSTTNVWTLDSAGRIYKYNSSTKTFQQTPGGLRQIGAGYSATFGINTAGQVWQYVSNAWSNIPETIAP